MAYLTTECLSYNTYFHANIYNFINHKSPDSFLLLYEEEYDHSLLLHEVMLAYQATLTQQLDCHNDLLRATVSRHSKKKKSPTSK